MRLAWKIAQRFFFSYFEEELDPELLDPLEELELLELELSLSDSLSLLSELEESLSSHFFFLVGISCFNFVEFLLFDLDLFFAWLIKFLLSLPANNLFNSLVLDSLYI